jgi:hypothetical protein
MKAATVQAPGAAPSLPSVTAGIAEVADGLDQLTGRLCERLDGYLGQEPAEPRPEESQPEQTTVLGILTRAYRTLNEVRRRIDRQLTRLEPMGKNG